ncbi:relaxase/mobilization nuclease domain-containing protein [Cryobacterium sp. MDB1-18-2]|uniref:relaxase/mobilization nuclease domain-containing protein n=1 Tax=unclassified Cryobacterium TaxID=2649013 RepID=UPI00321F60FD
MRRLHGKQGAKRKAPAKYELPEPGELASYIRRSRPNGRRYWAVAGNGEPATHVRREGEGDVDELQAVHVIVSFGLDEVNSSDPEQVRKAFEFVVKMMSELYPGVQMKLVGQADGAGKAFHVHCVANAVVAERMEVDGHVWEAGRKMSGALTDISRLRERADEFVAQHGAEYGVEQKLPKVTEQRAEKRSTRDRRMAAKGQISNHDIIRDAFEDSMNDARSVDVERFIEVLAERDVTVNHRVARAGKPGETHALSYRLDDMKTPVRGTTLGDHYAYESALKQLESNARGLPRDRRREQPHAGAAKPLQAPTAEELDDAQAVVERLAREERLAQADDRAAGDFFSALIEDFDSAIEAERTGDQAELARLADTTRDKEARRLTYQSQTIARSSPAGDPNAQPITTAQPRQPEPLTIPSVGWKERVQASLDEANAQGLAESTRIIAEYLQEKDAAKVADRDVQTVQAESDSPAVPAQGAHTKPPFGVSLSNLRKQLREAGEATARAQETAEPREATSVVEMINLAPKADEASPTSALTVGPDLAAERKTRIQRIRAELTDEDDEAFKSTESAALGD